MKEAEKMNPILDIDEIENHFVLFPQWQQEAFQSFVHKMTDSEHPFPCIPATLGFKLNHLRYAFIEEIQAEKSAYELASLLKEYGSLSKETGIYASLIIFMKSNTKVSSSILENERYFWHLLNCVSELDDKPWPAHIPQTPHNRYWEFCFNGEPYFIYCATPEHTLRRSRSFPVMMLAITPRWVLNHFHTSNPHADQIKSFIRERLAHYDQINPHPVLNRYGQEDNYEWKQYFLRDDQTTLSKCPFTSHHKKKNSH